jgi:hypothetical protein
LCPLHPPRASLRSVIEAVQMQKPMDDVEAKLTPERVSKSPAMPLRCFDTDKNFTVLKRKHVGRPRLVQESPVQKRHPTIRDKPDENRLRFT